MTKSYTAGMNKFRPDNTVSHSGAAQADNLLAGYVVVEADSFSAAEKLAAGAPSVASGRGSMLLPQH